MPLQAMCASLQSVCTAVHAAVMGGQVCDEEDMLLHTFGFRLDLPGGQAAKNTQQLLDRGITAAETLEGEAAKAVACRLRFRKRVLQALSLAYPPGAKSLKATALECDAACAELDAMQAMSLPEDALEAAPGFVPGVNNRAMGMAPPRPAVPVSFTSAIQYWRGALTALAGACRWLVECKTWPELRSNLIRFAAQGNVPIVRSVVHRALTFNMARQSVPAAQSAPALSPNGKTAECHWCPSEAMVAAEFGLPASPEEAPGAETKLFIEQCAIAVQGLVNTLCLNRCRQRRRLRRLLEDWRNMTDHAFNAEATSELQAWFASQGWTWKPTDEAGQPLAVSF